jgi:hypothetical protein
MPNKHKKVYHKSRKKATEKVEKTIPMEDRGELIDTMQNSWQTVVFVPRRFLDSSPSWDGIP